MTATPESDDELIEDLRVTAETERVDALLEALRGEQQ